MKKTLAEELRSYAKVLTEAQGIAKGSPEEIMQAFQQLEKYTYDYISRVNSFSELYEPGSMSLDLGEFLEEFLYDLETDIRDATGYEE